MILDANDITPRSEIQCDICIIGAGAAGITIARELSNTGQSVWLLESGGYKQESETQALYQGASSGRRYHPLDRTRLRYLGGTTNHWSGMCRPLDAIDFEKRDWIDYSGWPFNRDVLLPWYKRAHEYCELDEFNYSPGHWIPEAREMLGHGFSSFHPQVYQYSPPTRFGEAYRKELQDSVNVTVCLYANVTHLQAADPPRSIDHVRVSTLDGVNFRLKAGRYVLACGGIENVRLLLAANDIANNGLGNDHDLVGRFFMDHLVWLPGGRIESDEARIPHPVYFNTYTNTAGGRRMRPRTSFLLSEDQQSAQRIAGYNVMLFPSPRSKGEASYRYLQAMMARDGDINDLWQHLASMIADIGDVAPRVYEDYFSDASPHLKLILYHQWEQVPNPDSRITLASERDALGMPRVILDWRLSDLDRRTLSFARREFKQEIERIGLAEMIDDEIYGNALPEEVHSDNHQLGTTRMHDDPKQGVVDSDCRVQHVKYSLPCCILQWAANQDQTGLEQSGLAQGPGDALKPCCKP